MALKRKKENPLKVLISGDFLKSKRQDLNLRPLRPECNNVYIQTGIHSKIERDSLLLCEYPSKLGFFT